MEQRRPCAACRLTSIDGCSSCRANGVSQASQSDRETTVGVKKDKGIVQPAFRSGSDGVGAVHTYLYSFVHAPVQIASQAENWTVLHDWGWGTMPL